jgi:hypothetical protein
MVMCFHALFYQLSPICGVINQRYYHIGCSPYIFIFLSGFIYLICTL